MEKILVKNSTIAEMLGAVYIYTYTCILNNNKRAGVNTALKVIDKKGKPRLRVCWFSFFACKKLFL